MVIHSTLGHQFQHEYPVFWFAAVSITDTSIWYFYLFLRTYSILCSHQTSTPPSDFKPSPSFMVLLPPSLTTDLTIDDIWFSYQQYQRPPSMHQNRYSTSVLVFIPSTFLLHHDDWFRRVNFLFDERKPIIIFLWLAFVPRYWIRWIFLWRFWSNFIVDDDLSSRFTFNTFNSSFPFWIATCIIGW